MNQPKYSGLFYDCEIIRCIPDRNSANIPGLEYCSGWNDHANMGISVIGAFDTVEDRYRVFTSDNMDEFAMLVQERDCIIGFNSIGFDDVLCRANGIEVVTTYDILCEVRESVGQPRAFTPGRTSGGYKLEDMALANLGLGKSGSGATAPIDWQLGRIGTVIDYCLNDVAVTKKIFDKIQNHEFIDPRSKQPLRVATCDEVFHKSMNESVNSSGKLF